MYGKFACEAAARRTGEAMNPELSLLGAKAAQKRIAPYIRQTPLEAAPRLGPVFLKLESQQISGSFKPRGALNRLLQLSPEERAKGVIASTAGNHGIGLSLAGKILGIQTDIYLPRTADPAKIRMLEENGALLTFFDSVEAAREAAKAKAVETGKTFVSAYNDFGMMEGAGTIALEIMAELPDAEVVIVPMGGGGLAAGVATILKQIKPHIKVIAVQAENSPKMARWIEAGAEVDVALKPSIAEGLTVNMESGVITFPYLQKNLDGVILVSEAELRESMLWLLENHQQYTEPSGASAVAGIRKYLASNPQSEKIVGVVTGRNMSIDKFKKIQNAE